MKAVIEANLTVVNTVDAQRALADACERLVRDGVMIDYSFYVETPEGRVGSGCILSGDSVIA